MAFMGNDIDDMPIDLALEQGRGISAGVAAGLLCRHEFGPE